MGSFQSVVGAAPKAPCHSPADRAAESLADLQHIGLAQNSLEVRNQMLDVSVDCIKVIDIDGRLIHMNRSGCLALGVPVDETEFGMKWLDRLPVEVRKRGRQALAAALRGKKARFAGKSVLPGEQPKYWDNILTPMVDETGRTTAILCVSRDVTLQRVAQSRLRYASEVDALTGLWNRRSFRNHLQRLLARQLENGHGLGLILADVDYFKHVNDTLGHAAGDQLLRTLARRLLDSAPEGSFVARLGGDEFAIVVPDTTDDTDLMRVTSEIQLRAQTPVMAGGKPINSGMSLGCAIFPRDAGDVSALLKCADTALHHIKSRGRGGAEMFSAEMAAHAEKEAGQISLARLVVRSDALQPCYQPKVRLQDNRIIGFEALLRWKDCCGKVRLPNEVQAAFTDFDLATRLSEAMHHKVLADMAEWLASGRHVVPISLNAAPVEFLRDDYAERFLGLVKEYGIPHDLLEIEITEHGLVQRGADFVKRALNVMKDAGVRVALDDFGTGHSSLVHLRNYPVDTIKIDRTFIGRMLDDAGTLAIVQALCMLGPRLSMSIVAEGVETVTQAHALMGMGCEYAQGFLFSRPRFAKDILPLLPLPGRSTPWIGPSLSLIHEEPARQVGGA